MLIMIGYVVGAVATVNTIVLAQVRTIMYSNNMYLEVLSHSQIYARHGIKPACTDTQTALSCIPRNAVQSATQGSVKIT